MRNSFLVAHMREIRVALSIPIKLENSRKRWPSRIQIKWFHAIPLLHGCVCYTMLRQPAITFPHGAYRSQTKLDAAAYALEAASILSDVNS
jgi:hypothetical protein